ncbi:tetratricopeptide repeat protein [Rapidithrix thailandica]|uniref:Tetratricopeptide repeat protein n=1 Tax=Rapidithrix thailandica TaxID=413964 RepID=A0AAW9S8G7_9BACT
MNRSIKFLLLFLMILSLSDIAVAQRKKNKQKRRTDSQEVLSHHSQKRPAQVNDRDQIEAESIFIEAMKYFVLEDYETALNLFRKSDKVNSSSAATKYKIAHTLTRLRRFDEALPYAREATRFEETNEYYHKILAEIYRQLEEYDKAVESYRWLTIHSKSSENYFYELASIFLQKGEVDAAISVYNELEVKFGLNDSLIKQKQRIYLSQGNLDAALKEGEKLISAYPEVTEFGLAQAQLLLTNNRIEEATQMLEKLVENEPDDPHILLLMADIYKKQDRTEDYEKALEMAFSNAQLNVKQKVKILYNYLQVAYSEDKRVVGLKLAEIAKNAHPEDAQVNEVYASFLIANQKRKEARDYLLKSVQVDSDNFKAWQNLISLDWELNQVDSVIRHSESALELFPNQPLFYLYNGSGHYMKKDYMEAKAILEQGKMLSTDKELTNQINAQLGDIYHSLKEYDKSEGAYEEVLANDPNDLHVLNNYSYYLSLRGVKLDKAQEMGKKLMEIEPNNPTYLDTYGWILYIKGEYEEAEKYLNKAASFSGKATIIEHYGDVLYKLGQVEKALEQWKKAKEAGGAGVLDEKLAQKKLIE